MIQSVSPSSNPELDLVLERVVDIPPELVWAAWTQPEHLVKWFTPAPWTTVSCKIDLRPGGHFSTVMRSPEGEEMGGDEAGCYLEVVPNQRLVWTSALQPGYRPAVKSFLPFTAIITLEPVDSGTRYTARVLHGDAEARDRHAEMGFAEGWGKALDQLVAYMKTV